MVDISFYIAAVKLGYIKDENKYSVDRMISSLLKNYSKNYFSLRKDISKLEPIIVYAKNSFKSNSNIYYISDRKTAPLSLIDASECLPTFGVDFKTVRGLTVEGGYNSIFTKNQIKLIGNNFIKKHPLSVDVKNI